MHLDIFELQGFPYLGILSLWGWKMSQQLVEFSLRGRFLRCRFYTLVNKWSTAYLPPNISCTKQKANIYCPKILKILPWFFNSSKGDIIIHSINDEVTVSLVSLVSLLSLVSLVSQKYLTNWFPEIDWLSMIIIDYHWLSMIIIDYHRLSEKGESLHWLTHSLTTWNQEMLAHLKIKAKFFWTSCIHVDWGDCCPYFLNFSYCCVVHRLGWPLPSSKKIKNIHKEYLDWSDRCPDQLEPEAGFPHPLHHCRALQGLTSSVNNKSEKSARIRYWTLCWW